jgi:Ca-activated chloride channel family protein
MNKALVIVALFVFSAFSAAAQSNPEESSLTYGLVIDCSGSVGENLKYITATASSVVSSNGAFDQTFITRFISSDKIDTVEELTSDKTKLNRTIGGLYVEGGQTALVDGVYFAARYLADHATAGRRALLLISDGEDRQSNYTLDFLVKYLRDKNIPVYILFFGYHPPRLVTFINKLAQDSGGKVVFAEQGKDLPAKAPDVIRLLREGSFNRTTRPNERWARATVSVSFESSCARASPHHRRWASPGFRRGAG